MIAQMQTDCDSLGIDLCCGGLVCSLAEIIAVQYDMRCWGKWMNLLSSANYQTVLFMGEN